MEFCYKSEIKKLNPTCPPVEYFPIEIDCYRWVFDDIQDINNFKAQAEKNPKILNSKTDEKKCEIYALSFHTTEKSSRKHFDYFLAQNPKAYKRLGTHIAQGKIEKNDGVSGPTDNLKHFNFHHIKEHDFHNKFKIIGKL